MSIRANKSIFTFPELVIELVHIYLNPSDSACLARSNKHLFRMVMPLLWGRVDGVSQLLALLPALNGMDEAKNGQMPEKTLTNDFSRFDIYAPWVKHLEI
ncbi:hypothetical protein FS749_002804 [Ceratobasidium sp. UAMH 11750]|nr:hypothetical protein FS749_002804 [Ceratobasidium sp. UAMH 11750]